MYRDSMTSIDISGCGGFSFEFLAYPKPPDRPRVFGIHDAAICWPQGPR